MVASLTTAPYVVRLAAKILVNKHRFEELNTLRTDKFSGYGSQGKLDIINQSLRRMYYLLHKHLDCCSKQNLKMFF